MTKQSKNLFFIAVLAAILCFALVSCAGRAEVVFDRNDGTGVTERVAASPYLNPVPAPQREGYFFGGWWTAKEGGKLWSFDNDKAYKGLVLYARWSDATLTVSFDANVPDGEALNAEPPGIQRLAPGAKAVRPPEPELEGGRYYFGGWSKSQGSYVQWNFNAAIESDTVLYAFWTRYPVVGFDLGNDAGLVIGDLTPYGERKMRVGDKMDLPMRPTDESKGYLFEGWYADPGFNNRRDGTVTITGDAVFYAKWDRTVKLTFDVNAPNGADVGWQYGTEYLIRRGDTLLNAVEKGDIEYGPSYGGGGKGGIGWLLDGVAPADGGYNYAANAWYYAENGEEKLFSGFLYGGAALNASFNADTRIYVKWRRACFYRFDGEYRELFHYEETVTPSDGSETVITHLGTLPQYDNWRDGEVFVGWFYEGTDVQYFGEKAVQHTKFVSKRFTATAASQFDRVTVDGEYYAKPKAGFSAQTLVLPDYIFIGDIYVYRFIADLNDYPSVKNLVLGQNYHYNYYYHYNITFPKDHSGITVYQAYSGNSYCYGKKIYLFSIWGINEYPGSSYTVINNGLSIIPGLIEPYAALPVTGTLFINEFSAPVILEHRFMPHYGFKDAVLFCSDADLSAAEEKIRNGFMSGSVVYPLSYLENSVSNYLIRGNELIYYYALQNEYDGSTVTVDFRKPEFAAVTKLNTNGVIFSTASYYSTGVIYMPENLAGLESRAVQCCYSVIVYMPGDRPAMIYRARNDAEREVFGSKEENIPQTYDIWFNSPFNLPPAYGYSSVYVYVSWDYYDEYGQWAGNYNQLYVNVFISE